MPYHILLTFDIEDWFQVENFKNCIPFSSWPSCELRVEKNTHRILDLLDEVSNKRSAVSSQQGSEKTQGSNLDLLPRAKRSSNPESQGRSSSLPREMRSSFHRGETLLQPSPKIRATFFVLGWIAERLPGLVREIHSRGHEVASHGYSHNLCGDCSPEDLKNDLRDSKKILEDIIAAQVNGYRAPSFSIDDDILKIIGECGYLYDSSYNTFAIHSRYGKISLNGNGRNGIAYLISAGFYELPISNLPFFLFPNLGNLGTLPHFRHFSLPWGGGAYFRLIPFLIFKIGIQSILAKNGAYLFYMHPWELDAEQPKVSEASSFHKFRHYASLRKTYSKLSTFLQSFRECRFVTCNQYLHEMNGENAK